ncbi:hypothetical protein D3C81_2160100 [compost metagenome]
MVGVDKSLAVGEDDLALLDSLLGWQAAIGFAQAHGTTGEHGPHAQVTNGLHLNINGVFQAIGEQIVMVGCRGAARQQ